MEFLVTEIFFPQKHLPGVLKRQQNVHGVLKCMHKFLFFSEGGGGLGCLGRPTPPPGGYAGSEKRYTSSYDHDM